MSKKQNTIPNKGDVSFNEIIFTKIAVLLKVIDSVNFKRNRCIDTINLILNNHSSHPDLYDRLEKQFLALSTHESTLKTTTYYIDQLEKQLKQ